jgi:hypothetical protein
MVTFARRLLARTPVAPHVRRLRRLLRLTPMCRVLRELERRGVTLTELAALEVFGREGVWHTQDYAGRVERLEVWEIDESFERGLKRNLPRATIKITDSFTEVKLTRNKFGLVVIDNPMSVYGKYCEHFELFPDIFRVLDDEAVIIVNVVSSISPEARTTYPYLFSKEHLDRRRTFYGTHRPEKLSPETIVDAYRQMARRHDFGLEWSFFVARALPVYCVLKVKRGLPPVPAPSSLSRSSAPRACDVRASDASVADV